MTPAPSRTGVIMVTSVIAGTTAAVIVLSGLRGQMRGQDDRSRHRSSDRGGDEARGGTTATAKAMAAAAAVEAGTAAVLIGVRAVRASVPLIVTGPRRRPLIEAGRELPRPTHPTPGGQAAEQEDRRC